MVVERGWAAPFGRRDSLPLESLHLAGLSEDDLGSLVCRGIANTIILLILICKVKLLIVKFMLF